MSFHAKKCPRVVIIGAGVIGIAIARELAQTFDVTVLEACSNPAQVTSRLNSGVIHSGMHLPPHSLKAKFAREGSKKIEAYCIAHKIPYRSCGMLVVASYPELLDVLAEFRGFWRVYRRGKQQDIGMHFLFPWQIKRLEPNVKAVGGLFAPGVIILDQPRYCMSLVEEAEGRGATFMYNAKVDHIEEKKGTYRIHSARGEFSADILINAAGLYADVISEKAGGPRYPVYFYRGEYYEVKGPDSALVSRLVYPVYRLGGSGLGIHFTPTIDGRLLIGPNAKRVAGPEDYETDKTHEFIFRESVSRFCPKLKNAKLKWAFSGIRPKLSNDGSEADFIIKIEKRCPMLLNLIGIESPGFTSSLAIAEYVKKLLNQE